MFEWVEKHKRWIMIGLSILIIPSFAMFGINYYFDDSSGSGAVAKVAGTTISPGEFEQALRERQDQLRQMMKDKADPAMLDSNEVRNAVVNSLVERRALLAHALTSGLAVPDEQVRKVITEVPYFRDEATGGFSSTKYEELLRRQGRTPVMFEEGIRQDLRVSQVRDTVNGSALISDTVVKRLGKLREQQREISQWTMTPDQVFARVTVTDEEVRKFYDDHQSDFRIPERVKVEYVVLTPEDAAKGVAIPEAEVRAVYEKNAAQYGKPEERRASHILLTVAKDAKPEAKAEIKARAEKILEELRKAPKTFADIAKKESQDPGSAANGGDLGFNARGAMVKPFDDAVFTMKVGEFAGPVETQYGFHIIRLDAIKAGETVPFEKARGDIEAELRKAQAGKLFADAAEELQIKVVEQSDSLKPAAEALRLTVQTSDWITRNGGGQPATLVKPAMLAKIFSEDSLKQKRNTDAIEVDANTVISARVVDFREAHVLPFDEIKGEVRRQVQIDKALKLAEQEGKAALERVKKGDDKGLTWSAPTMVSLGNPGALQAEAARDVFGADPAKLPVYVGVPADKGRFVIYRVSKVVEAPEPSADVRKTLAKQIAQLAAQQQFDAYTQTVKASMGVSVDTAKVQKKAQ
jgi:peptidyl-prolyl cis-trans isomerase D